MAERTMTITQTQQQSTSECSPILHLRLKKPKSRKKVKWTNDTVDNETMGKKKSKCCCVYEKPRVFGESSSEDDSDECDSCRGHKPNCYKQDDSEGKTSHGPSGSEGGGGHDPADDNPHSPSGSDANEGGAVGGTFI